MVIFFPLPQKHTDDLKKGSRRDLKFLLSCHPPWAAPATRQKWKQHRVGAGWVAQGRWVVGAGADPPAAPARGPSPGKGGEAALAEAALRKLLLGSAPRGASTALLPQGRRACPARPGPAPGEGPARGEGPAPRGAGLGAGGSRSEGGWKAWMWGLCALAEPAGWVSGCSLI